MIADKLAAAGAAKLSHAGRCHACRGGLRGPLGTRGMEARAYATSGRVRASARAVMCVRDGVFKRPGWLRNRRNRRPLRPFQSAAGEKNCDFEGLSKKFLWILSEFQLPG